MISRIQQNPQRVLLLLLAIVTLLYLYGVRQQFLYVNTDMSRTDQGAYLHAAELLKTSNYTALTDRNRMPVYPFLLSLLYEPGMNETDFFARGKLFSIALSLIILPILYWIFRQRLPLFTAVNLLLIHVFTIYIFKAAYTQTELLFYLFNFLIFLLMCRLLRQPSWQWSIITGIATGLTHLIKASVLPGLAMFIAIALLQATILSFKEKSEQPILKNFARHFATPSLVLLFFLLTIFPYIQNSKERFGHYFYNVNSTFYIWYDSWDEAKAGTRAHGDRVGWPDMPAEELPSAAKYFREHTPSQVWARLSKGFLVILISMSTSYGYLKYLVLLFSFCLALLIFNFKQAKLIVTTRPYLSLFAFSYFAIYITLYAWYWPIAAGNRFILALFSPFVFTCGLIIYRYFENQLSIKISRNSLRSANLGTLLNYLIFSLLLVDGYIILTVRIGNLYGGY